MHKKQERSAIEKKVKCNLFHVRILERLLAHTGNRARDKKCAIKNDHIPRSERVILHFSPYYYDMTW